jgi:hypothetical protein
LLSEPQNARQAVQDGLQRLERDRSFYVLAWSYGLAGYDPKPLDVIAEMFLTTAPGVHRMRHEAEQELRQVLIAC